MGIEIVADKMPARGRGVSGDDSLHMRQKVCFSPRWPSSRSKHSPGDDVATEDEGERAMPDVLKFTPFHFARRHRQPWMFLFQGLHTRQLVRAHRALALRVSLWCIS